jgi:ribosomal protein S18 acetylase RimI-like enzyme
MGLAIATTSTTPDVVPPAVSISVRRATAADLPALARLVNRAYQVEAFFVDGDRTGTAELAVMAERGHFLVLDGKGGELAASVYVRVDDDDGTFGRRGWLAMLAVAPDLQKRGLGHRLVAVVEALCAALGCGAVALQVVNLRDELASWYRSLGYRDVGTAPYDHRPVRQACHMVRMEKSLRTAASL